MAFGFPASYTTSVNLVGSRQTAREAVDGTLQALAWHYVTIGRDVFKVHMRMNALTWGETLTITLTDEGSAVISSACSFPLQLFDWGQNKRNVNQFASLFTVRDIREAKLDLKEPVHFDDDGQTPVERMIADSSSRNNQHTVSTSKP